MRAVSLRAEWLAHLEAEFKQPYMRELSAFLREEKAAGKQIYPPGSQIFAALESNPPASVRVVILGQDPYHGPGQAHGHSFSVLPGQRIPPSLRNIYAELKQDLDCVPPRHGHLAHWVEQGVLLLNAVLTVESGQAGSHQGRGWETFTDRVVDVLNREGDPKVFMLWGAHAQRKGRGIDTDRHQVLSAPHPSPLSAHRGFLGCGHFSAANRFLESRGRGVIDWQLPD